VTAPRLVDAIAAVRSVAAAAGLPADAVAREGANVAAGVCADVEGASGPWAEAFGQSPGGFGAAAEVGRAFASERTPLLASLVAAGRTEDARSYAAALAGLAAEACALDPDPTLACINAAGFVARAQLNAVAPQPGLTPGVPDYVTPPVPAGATATATTTAPTATAAATAEAPVKPLPTLPELMAQLDALVGLRAVKDQVHRQTELLRINILRKEKGLKTPEVSRHLVFVGNPGTGKSTVARLVAGIYRALGLLEKGQLVETDRSGMVAGYVGQTALKTADVVKSATGGVLFIDEAYALAGDDFGSEAIATLLKAMEDHRDELVVIAAGYPDEMEKFITSNPGLESRFGTTITFPDYSEDELVAIFRGACSDADFTPTSGCVDRLQELIRAEPRNKGFGNARLVRNLFEAAVARQAWRLRKKQSPTLDDLRRLQADDLPDQIDPP